MFLPVILLRDYGVFAWIAFALPNVIGAAAMGWVLYRQGSSEDLVATHSPAMAAFSVVTILFHLLFFGWIIRWLGGWTWVAIGGGVAIAAFPLLAPRRTALALSAVVWIVSVALFVIAARSTQIAATPYGQPTLDLLWLTPAFVLGFLLCPYLDLTFHRARQAVGPYGSVAAFTLGFGVLFLVMIVFTLWYGPMTIPPDALRLGGSPRGLERTPAIAVVAHMTIQAGFTIAAHAFELHRKSRRRTPRYRAGIVAGLLFGLPILVAAFMLAGKSLAVGSSDLYYRDLSATEIGYRLFMAFYGLVAPAYVWLFMVPYRDVRPSERAKWTTFAIVMVVAGAAMWMGFIERQMVWVPGGIAVILLSRYVLRWVAR